MKLIDGSDRQDGQLAVIWVWFILFCLKVSFHVWVFIFNFF